MLQVAFTFMFWSSDRLCGLVPRVPIQRSGFDSRRYQIFGKVADLERGPLSLVSTIEELVERKSSESGLESREHGRRDVFYPQKLALTSPTGSGRSVGIVRLRTHATEFSLFFILFIY
jgi:hypothetical protein